MPSPNHNTPARRVAPAPRRTCPGPLASWDRFPAARQPRPVLLNPNQSLPQTAKGFGTDTAKLAVLCGRIELPGGGLPPAPATAMVRWPHGSAMQYPAASLQRVFAWVWARGPAIANPDCPHRAALPATGARLGTASSAPTVARHR